MKKKFINIFSNGSIHINFAKINKFKKLKIHEIDHINFIVNKKIDTNNNNKISYSSNYKKHYLF